MKEPFVRIALDLHKASERTAVALKHRDVGRKIAISLSEEGVPYEIADDCYAVLTATKPDGNILYNHCDIAGDTVFYEVTEQTTAKAGRMKAEVKLYGPEDNLITSAAFRIVVEGTICPEGQLESREEVSALTHLVSEAAAVIRTGNETIRQAEDAAQAAQNAKALLEESQVRLNQWLETSNQIFREVRADADLAVEEANSAAENAVAAISGLEEVLADANAAVETAGSSAEAANTAARETVTAREDFLQAAGDALDAVYKVVAEATDDAPAIVCSDHGRIIALDDSGNRLLHGLKVFGKTTQNGTPTPEAPAELVSVGDVNMTVAGKNLLDNKAVSKTESGVTFTANADGSITLVGESTAQVVYFLRQGSDQTQEIPNGDYIVSGTPGASNDTYYITSYDGTDAIKRFNAYATDTNVNISNGCLFQPRIIVRSGVTVNVTFYPMLRLASITDATYEPYKEVQTVSVSTPNGLPGIPVISGGNYTDENGQQWICDYVDFEKGQYVQRVKRRTLLSSDVWLANTEGKRYWVDDTEINKANVSAICTHYQRADSWVNHIDTDGTFVVHRDPSWAYGRISFIDNRISSLDEWKQFLNTNEVTIIYEQEKENRIPLSAEKLAAFASMQSHYPNTTVYNDTGAGMEVKYVADTKLYIDKKFTDLATALVNNV